MPSSLTSPEGVLLSIVAGVLLGALAGLSFLVLRIRRQAEGLRSTSERTIAGLEGKISGLEVALEALKPAPEDPPAEAPGRRHLCVLVVDDERSLATATKRMLERVGYCVEAVLSGAEGLAALERARPKVVLLDLSMPTMSGADFRAEQIRRKLDDAPVVLMSGNDLAPDLVEWLGVAGVLQKPFVVSELFVLLERMGILAAACESEKKALGRADTEAMRPPGDPVS